MTSSRHLTSLPPIPTPPKPKTSFSTVPEIAEFLRVSRMTVYRMVHDGTLPSYQFGTLIRVPTEAVWDYVSGRQVNRDSFEKAKAL